MQLYVVFRKKKNFWVSGSCGASGGKGRFAWNDYNAGKLKRLKYN
jgi:hypothetical protein